jgi:hypothetical protein
MMTDLLRVARMVVPCAMGRGDADAIDVARTSADRLDVDAASAVESGGVQR